MDKQMVDRDRLQCLVESDLLELTGGYMSNKPFAQKAMSFAVRRQLHDLNRKSNDLGVTPQLADASFRKFQLIQQELRDLDAEEFEHLEEVKHLVSSWLPPLAHVWDEVWNHCGFGPGSVFHARSDVEKSLLFKIGGDQTVTPKAYYLAIEVLGRYYPRFASRVRDVTIVKGNRLAHVPKDVSKCRQIAVEPSLNIFLQKGVGSYLSALLKKRGVADLENGQQHHRDLVRDFMKVGTIDLSDASDRISIKAMKAILPPDWYELLDALRSHFYRHHGVWYEYSSFSSQGNAFTFPLETLVFKAIALAARKCSVGVSVYGDDIIAGRASCPSICDALESYGFKVNADKSFWGQHNGELKFFRESCGEDTLYGIPVRPVFFKDPATHESGVAALANRLYERWGFMPRTHEYLIDIVKPSRRLTGPRTFWSADDYGLINRKATEYSSWFWEELIEDVTGSTPLKWRYNPCYQTHLIKVKYWSTQARELPVRCRLWETDQLLAFLYGGSPYQSPLSNPVVRTRVLTKGSMAS